MFNTTEKKILKEIFLIIFILFLQKKSLKHNSIYLR